MPRNWPPRYHANAATTLLLLSLTVGSSTATGQPPSAPATEQAVRKWTRDLDAGQFAQRKRARNKLVEIGGPAIRLVQQTVLDNLENRELQMQAMEVLQALVAQDDVSVRQAAIDALTQIAEQSGDRRAEHAAKRLLADHERLIAMDAWEQLKKLGAKQDNDYSRTQLQPESKLPVSVVIDREWRGSADDMRLLQPLNELKSLKLIGESIDNEYLAGVSQLNQVMALIIERAKITSEGLAKLGRLKSLVHLTVKETPLTNERGRLVAALQGLAASDINLFSTELNRTEVTEIVEAIPSTKAKLHFGAFLGVGPVHMQGGKGKGCVLNLVAPGSAAAKAGLRVADTIVKYGDKPIANFPELRDLIGLDSPGDKVAIELHRPKRQQHWLEDFRIEPPGQIEEPKKAPEQPADKQLGKKPPAADDPKSDYEVLVKEVTLGEVPP